MNETRHYCLKDDCKNIATENPIEGRPVRCTIHPMQPELYDKTLNYIKRFREIHGERYTYFKTYYIHHREKVIITCREHGDFRMRTDGHLSGCQCQECARFIKHRKTTAEFIEDAMKVHGDKYNYEKVEYKDHNTPVVIICPEHGEFKQVPTNHLIGHNCKKCGFKINAQSRTSTTEMFIEKAKKIHGDKYQYDNVVYTGTEYHVTITCIKHGDFNQVAGYHLSGNGCTKCAFERQIITQTKPFEQFIEEAKRIHGDTYDYSLVKYVKSDVPVEIICKEHAVFKQKPSEHLLGSGCRKCGIIRRAFKQRLTNEEFIEKAKKIHGDKYDYSKVDYQTSGHKITLICPKHKDFELEASSHLQGCGCQRCGIESRAEFWRLDVNDIIRRANQIHNNSYDYSLMEYKNNRIHVKIICHKQFRDGREHGIFEQSIHMHLDYKTGCPRCNFRRYSKVQIEWLENIMSFTGIPIQHVENDIEHRIRGTNKYADGYSKEHNTIFEFHGCYYHGCMKCYPDREVINRRNKKSFEWLYQYTLQKEQECRDQGYNLISIWQCDWNDLKKSPERLDEYMTNIKEQLNKYRTETI